MVSINIKKAVSSDNLKELESLFRGKTWKSVQIKMDYNLQKGLPDEEQVEAWPFKALLVDEDEMYEVRIYSLTVGYGGTGPHDFKAILDFFQVPYGENAIFTDAKMGPDGFIRLRYTKFTRQTKTPTADAYIKASAVFLY